MSTLKVVSVQHPSSAAANLTLAADGTVTGGLPAGGRNLLYNGAMQVAQRSTSVASISSAASGDYYTADRWKFFVNTLGTWTQSVENDAPTGSGLRKSLKMLCTTAKASLGSGDYLIVAQSLEGQDCQRIAKGTASAQQLTLSFWVKSNVTGTYIAELEDVTNARSVSASYTISASATWERKTLTFPADTTGTLANDNTSALSANFFLAVGSQFTSGTLATAWGTRTNANRAVGQTNLAASTNNYWQVTGVQLEVGPVASSFEFKPYGQELRDCQRYYWRESRSASGQGNTLGGNIGNATTTTTVDANIPFPTAMRTNPSAVEQTNLAAYGWRLTTFYSTGTWTIPFGTDRGCTLRYTHGTGVFTINDVVSVMSNAAGTYYLGFSAEL